MKTAVTSDEIRVLVKYHQDMAQMWFNTLNPVKEKEKSYKERKSSAVKLRNSGATETIATSPMPHLTVKQVIETVCDVFKVAEAAAISKKRTRPLPQVRWTILKILKTHNIGCTTWSALGNIVGVDHTSAMYSIGKFNSLYETDKGLRKNYHEAINRLSAQS